MEKNVLQLNNFKKQAGVAILIFLKEIGKNTTSYILIKGKFHQKYIAIININSPKTKAPMSIKETPLQLNSYFGVHTVSGCLQYPTITKRQVIQTKTKQIRVGGK